MPNWGNEGSNQTSLKEPLETQTLPQRFLYRGISMRLLFSPGDSLEVTPVSLDQIRVGDVIIFRNINASEEGNWTVHRVIVHLRDGLVTQGDNNLRSDINRVTADNLVGVVRTYERNGRIRHVRGGRGGLFYSRSMRRLRWLVRYVMGLGRYPYRWLRGSGLVRRFWRPNLVRVQIETEQGTLVKYIHRRRTVATWHSERNVFSVHKPYDLVISPPEKDQMK
jgi:hypothetical protein